MTIDLEKFHAELRRDAQRTLVLALLGAVASIGAGVALGVFLASILPPPPQMMVIQEGP